MEAKTEAGKKGDKNRDHTAVINSRARQTLALVTWPLMKSWKNPTPAIDTVVPCADAAVTEKSLRSYT